LLALQREKREERGRKGEVPAHVYEAIECFGACFEAGHSAGEIGDCYCGVHAVCEVICHFEGIRSADI
jgi:hypothetical protein